MSKISELVNQHRIIPVLTEDNPDIALKIVEALAKGGLGCIEVALRTPNALLVIEALRREFSEICVGAGTLKFANDFSKVHRAGAQFAVSPGMTAALLDEAENWDLPYLPAAATVSELLALHDRGHKTVKLFPAGPMGGIDYIKAISAPLPDIRFVPSGGVDESNLKKYLELTQVAAVSGSWMIPGEAVETGDWTRLTTLASNCLTVLSSQGILSQE